MSIALKPCTSIPVTAISNNSTESEVTKQHRARNKAELNGTKRSRETDETPPNAQQPHKSKANKNPLSIQTVVSTKQPIDDKKGNTKAPVSPVKEIPQSSVN